MAHAASSRKEQSVIHCQRDPYQPKFPSIAEVRYTHSVSCPYAEHEAERFAVDWYREGARTGTFKFVAVRGTHGWAVTVRSQDHGQAFAASMDLGHGVMIDFELGS
jgi:hypothetical protein